MVFNKEEKLINLRQEDIYGSIMVINYIMEYGKMYFFFKRFKILCFKKKNVNYYKKHNAKTFY